MFLTLNVTCDRMKMCIMLERYITIIGVKTVDKHEYRLKTEQMLQYMEKKSYREAMAIADSIDWRKVKNTSILCTVSGIYESNGEYQKGRDILFLAYDRSPDSKKVVYRLSTLALKMGEIKEATECYEEFVELAPHDPNQYILKYKILKTKKAPLGEQIEVLEKFKKEEYVEKWAFELAKLYQEAGMITEALEECDDLILWFNEGEYVYKAMELKMNYKPLTPLQQEKYMSRPGAVQEPKKQAEAVVEPVVVVEERTAEVPVVEEVAETVAEKVAEEPVQEKSSLSIEEMVYEWQEKQRENAQLIQAEREKLVQEKEQNELVDEKEKTKEVLPDDIRKLMEELEAESADIQARKENTVPEEAPVKVEEEPVAVEKQIETVADEYLVKEVAVPEEEEAFLEEESFAKAISEVINSVEEESTGIKLGDTQSIALSAKALASAAKVDVPQVDIQETTEEEETVRKETPYDTSFIVKGRYDLEAQSAIGLKAGLTEEQKKLFSYFVPVHGMSEQIVQVLQNDKKCKSRYGTSRIGNLLIIGRKGSGKTVLAVDIVKAIQKARKMKQGKVAIVTSEALNKKDVTQILEKLHGGAVIIEKASRLNRRTVEQLCDVMEGQTGEMLVVLEDERKPLERLLSNHPNFAKKFTSKIELPVFINDELVTFGQTYAKENGYKIDEMGILALYSRIDMMQREEQVVTVANVKDILDEAIENANRVSVKKFMKKILGKNTDELDRVILREEDFR